MATSAIPGAIDFLVATAKSLFTDPAIAVSDGWFTGKSLQVLMIGITRDDPNTVIQATWAGLGANAQDESFDIPGVILCLGGDSSQKGTRDQAFAIYNSLVTAILANKTLGGALTPPGIAQITRGQLLQTPNAEEAGDGRVAQIAFTVHCTSRLTP